MLNFGDQRSGRGELPRTTEELEKQQTMTTAFTLLGTKFYELCELN